MPTKEQVRANQANAELSTGPRTEEGKRIASHNALKTGLTGRTILLPTDDIAHYEAHLARIAARYQPESDEEALHTETIAHIEWRLRRIPTLETGILALGRKQLADKHADESLDNRIVMIEAEVHILYQKQLANLALQEARLNRQHERELARLEALQAPRKAQREKLLNEAAKFYDYCQRQGQTFSFKDMQQFGFEFSKDELQRHIGQQRVARICGWPTIEAYYNFQEIKNA